MLLGTDDMINGSRTQCHVISFASNTIHRVCRATVQAETYNLQQVVENGDILRAAITDCQGLLDHLNWEASAAAHIRCCWFTDCKSTHAGLLRPVQAKMQDKRLGLEFASLRQSLWRVTGETPVEARLRDDRRATYVSGTIRTS